MIRYKNLISLLLVSALMWNTFHVAFTYGYYYLDKSGFIDQFCVNIEKPKLECNGKCQIKKVVEDKTTNDKVPIKIIESKDITLFVLEKKKIEFGFIFDNIKETKKYNNLYSYLSEYMLYHPPKV